jgi:hypothetical protein
MNKRVVRNWAFILVGSIIGYHWLNRSAQLPYQSLEQRLRTELAQAEKNKNISNILLLLKIIVDDAVQKGQKAPSYNMCELTINHSPHLFCKLNKGIERIFMPQLTGRPIPGSQADRLPRNQWQEVDASQTFANYLRTTKGYTITLESVPAATLKATQNELVGSKVASIWYAMENPQSDAYKKITDMPLFISADNYILDGHHRWAAAVAHGIGQDNLNNVRMKVERIHVPIDQLIHDANEFVRMFGIQPESGK